MIMVFKVETLFRQIETLCPDVARLFSTLANVIGTRAEKREVEELYLRLRPLNFSKDILEKIAVRFPGSISVLPVLQITWSDWGSPKRLMEVITAIERAAKPAELPRHPPFSAHSPPALKSVSP
jgi:hypothetical protein